MPAFVPAAARAMSLFELFSREKRELSNSEVARLLDMPESSSLDLLHTLHQAGYLLRTARTRRFYPTGRLLWASQQISANDPRFLLGQEAVELLADKTGETALCGVIDDGAVRIIAVNQGRHQLRYVLNAGERIALNVSALGRALLAAMTPEEARRQMELKPMPQLTEKSLTSVEAIEAAIDAQRARGWYAIEGESVAGVTAYAMVGSIGDEVVGISIAGPSDRFTAHHDAYIAAMQEVAQVSFPA